MDRNVRLFDGSIVRIECSDEDRAEVINSVMIEPFMDELIEGWLASGERSMPAENRVKAYLTYVGYLLIEKPDSHGVLSMNKIRRIKKREISSDDLDTPCKTTPIVCGRRKKKLTKFEKYGRITAIGDNPVCARVDTEGCFEYNGTIFKVVDMKYAGEKAVGWDCPYYQFDRIWIQRENFTDDLRFYDQNLDPIPDEHIFTKT